ncbi:MAG TPA: hypothetical protein VFI61_04590 [Patescibacteria group bacterium]|nr:hypothetical protein [Patescibacteria group bacterium]
MSLTTNDLKLIKDVMKITIDEELDSKMDEKLGYLPTKEEFFASEDRLMGELKAVREEITMLSDLNRKVNDHDERIEVVEKKLNIQPVI